MKEAQGNQVNDAGNANVDRWKMYKIDMHNACEATDVEGQYGPWIIGTNIPVGGPSSSKSLPRRNTNPKVGAVTKNGGTMWASKTPGSLNHKDKPTSGLAVHILLFASTKYAKSRKEKDTSPGLPHRVHNTYPFSMKDKKTIARSLASNTPSKSTTTPCLEGIARKFITLSSTSPSPPCHGPKQPTSTTFKFSAMTKTEKGQNLGSESNRRTGAHHVGEKRVSYTSDMMNCPYKERHEVHPLPTNEGNQEISPQANVGAQFPT
nr:hypothetical protein CFP56_76702 [Quercus suber]